MDLNPGQLIAQNIVHRIPVTDVVVKAVETMARDQGFKSLKFKNRHGVIFHNADWIAEVDCDDNEDDGDDDTDEACQDKAKNEKVDDEADHQDMIDPEEDDDLTEDARQEVNPNQHDEAEQQDHLEEPLDQPNVNLVSKGEEESQATKSTRRLTCKTRTVA